MKYRPPRTVIGMAPSAPWWPCSAARPPAGERRAGKRGHDEDTAQEQKLRAPARHPPPPASAPSAAASACSVVRAPCRSPALSCARRAAPAGVLRPVVMACARSNVPQVGSGRVHDGCSAVVEGEVGSRTDRGGCVQVSGCLEGGWGWGHGAFLLSSASRRSEPINLGADSLSNDWYLDICQSLVVHVLWALSFVHVGCGPYLLCRLWALSFVPDGCGLYLILDK